MGSNKNIQVKINNGDINHPEWTLNCPRYHCNIYWHVLFVTRHHTIHRSKGQMYEKMQCSGSWSLDYWNKIHVEVYVYNSFFFSWCIFEWRPWYQPFTLGCSKHLTDKQECVVSTKDIIQCNLLKRWHGRYENNYLKECFPTGVCYINNQDSCVWHRFQKAMFNIVKWHFLFSKSKLDKLF